MLGEPDALDVGLALLGVEGQALRQVRRAIRESGILEGGDQLVEVVGGGGGQDDLPLLNVVLEIEEGELPVEQLSCSRRTEAVYAPS